MIFNYIRVSTIEQNTERQLRDVVCDRVYEEKISGKDTNRPQLQAMLSNIRSGDIINIHEMSRLARNTRDLLNLVEEITSKGATIIFHKENITFNGNEKQDPYQKMMMTMLGAVAELERSILLERQREGIALAKLHNKYKGGKNKLTTEQVAELNTLRKQGMPIARIAKQFKITRPTVYSYLRMKKSKMLKEDLKSLREQENAEIVQHLEAISEIIANKCKRCDSVLGCLGCVFSQGEMKSDIEHARKLIKKII